MDSDIGSDIGMDIGCCATAALHHSSETYNMLFTKKLLNRKTEKLAAFRGAMLDAAMDSEEWENQIRSGRLEGRFRKKSCVRSEECTACKLFEGRASVEA